MRMLISVCQASLECLCTIVIFYWIIIIKHKTQINFSNNTFFLTSDSTKYNLGFYGFGLSTHVEVYNNCKDHKNQQELKVETCKLPLALEYTRKQVTVDFSLTFD